MNREAWAWAVWFVWTCDCFDASLRRVETPDGPRLDGDAQRASMRHAGRAWRTLCSILLPNERREVRREVNLRREPFVSEDERAAAEMVLGRWPDLAPERPR